MSKLFIDRTRRLFSLCLMLFLLIGSPQVQALIAVDAAHSSSLAEKLIRDMAGDDFEVKRVNVSAQVGGWCKVAGSCSQVGSFSKGSEQVTEGNNLGIESGVILSTGHVETLAQKEKYEGCAYSRSNTDSDLTKLLYGGKEHLVYDPVMITFELIPKTNKLSIDFVFGSDEYEANIEGSNKRIAAFGFLVSGPGIKGEFSNNAVNMAVLPSSKETVSINNVNRLRNSDYYLRNYAVKYLQPDGPYWDLVDDYKGEHVAMHGWTKVINSQLPVQKGKVYRVKIILGEDTNQANDSSVFIGQFNSKKSISRIFKGRIFHHLIGSVNEEKLAEGANSFKYFSNARVVLFDAAGKQVKETKTSESGEYSFKIDDEQRYEIAVDAATLQDAGVNYPEQTWSSVGGLCLNENYTPYTLTTSRYCYGGKTGKGNDQLNTKNTLESAKHVITVPESTESNSRLNFGFSFDVVSHTEGKGQGSLRNFIINANAGAGSGQMLFVPAVPANHNTAWKIGLHSPLPAITRSPLTIAGRAKSLLDPTKPVNSEKIIKDGLSVGVSQSPLAPWYAPDLHIEARSTQAAILQLDGAKQVIDRIALTNGSDAKTVGIKASAQCSNCTVSNTVIGRDPFGDAASQPFYRGVEAAAGSKLALEHSWVSYGVDSGVRTQGSGKFENNFLESNGTKNASAAAFSLPGDEQQTLTITKNYIQGANGYLVDARSKKKTGFFKVSENTFKEGGLQSTGGHGGGLIVQARELVDIRFNRFESNRGAGVVIQNSTGHKGLGTRVVRNDFFANRSIPIDLIPSRQQTPNGTNAATGKYDNAEPNRGIDAPYIKSVVQEGSALVVEGFSMPGVTLEFYQVQGGKYRFLFERKEGSQDDATGTAQYYDPVSGRLITQEQFKFTIPNQTLNGQLSAIAVDASGNTSEFSIEKAIALPGSVKTQLWQDQNNDGIRQAGESGFAGVYVALSKIESGVAVLVQKVSTDSEGKITFTKVLPGQYQVEVLPDQAVLKDWQLGKGMTNPFAVTVEPDKKASVNFGYVKSAADFSFTPEYQRAVAAGQTTRFSHQLLSSKALAVQLSYQWLDSTGKPLKLNWPVRLLASNCDESGQTPLPATINLEADKPLCFDAVVAVSQSSPPGLGAKLELLVTYTDPQTAKQVVKAIHNSITVASQGGGRLVLYKQVQNVSEKNLQPGTANAASPGDRLSYTLLFSNPGAGHLESLTLRDSTPAFTALASEVKCPDNLPELLGKCTVSTSDNQKTYAGYQGDIIWTFTGKLAPGASGLVSFEVEVE